MIPEFHWSVIASTDPNQLVVKKFYPYDGEGGMHQCHSFGYAPDRLHND